MASTKKHAYELIDQLPETQLSAVVNLLEAILDPLQLASVPEEEEDLTDETIAAMECGRASIARGEGISHDEIRREFGLKK